MRIPCPTTQRHGFSLIELLVAMALMGVVILYMMQSFTTQHRTYVLVDQVTEAQQNLRAVSELLENDVRAAGFLVPKGAGVCGIDRTTAPDTLFVSNADVIRTVDSLATVDVNKVAGNLGAPVTVAAGTTLSGASQVLNLTQNWVDVAADGSDFAIGAGVILVDTNDTNVRAACGVITAINGNNVTVDMGPTTLGPTGVYSQVLAIPAHVYTVNAPAGAPSQLLRDGLALASDIEDLQVAYFVDANSNRVIDAGEYQGDGTAANYSAANVNGSQIRELRVDLVMATRDDDPNQLFREGSGQATENRTAASVAGTDGRRRRVHQATLRLRNARTT